MPRVSGWHPCPRDRSSALKSTPSVRRTLLAFSKRSAVFAVRERKPDLIWDSLIAHAIEDLAAGDVRDNLVALGLVFHCARRFRMSRSKSFTK